MKSRCVVPHSCGTPNENVLDVLKGGSYAKFILGTFMLASLGTVAARQPSVGNGDHMKMMQNCPMNGGMMSSVDVKIEATENGARLTFTPKDPAMLSELQD